MEIFRSFMYNIIKTLGWMDFVKSFIHAFHCSKTILCGVVL